MATKEPPLLTPDGRYLIVRGRLWRTANPHLPESERQQYVNELMHARRAVGTALKSKDATALSEARACVQAFKEKLGERGPVWWPVENEKTDRDFTRTLAKNSPYAAWYASLSDTE